MQRNVVQTKSVSNAGATETPLSRLAEKGADGKYIYYDPLALKSRDGQSINLREQMYESGGWKDKFEAINEAVSKTAGFNGGETKEAVKSALDTPRVSLPVHTSPDIFISDKQDLPVKDALARVAVSEDEIRLDEITNVGEPTSSVDEVDTAEVVDDTIEKYKYNIEQVYVRKEVSDKLVATGRYDPSKTSTELASEGIARYLEKQAIWGTDNDAGSFEGLYDFADSSQITDGTDTTVDEEMFRGVVTELNKNGVAEENQMLVCDHDTFGELKTALSTKERFTATTDTDTYSFGSLALEVDGVMINPSHGIEDRGDDKRAIFNFDATAHAWYYLSDTSVKMTGITQTNDTTEEMVVYEQVVFGSEGKENIAVVENIGQTAA